MERFASFTWIVDEPMLFLVTMLLARAMLVAHEFAHGLTCKHYGGPVRRMGLLFVYFSPGAYCDVTSLHLCEKKWQRALVGLAGVGSDLFFSSLMTWAFYLLRPDTLLAQATPALLLVNGFAILNNLNAIFQNDGHLVLTEMIDQPEFRKDAFNYFHRRVKAFFQGSHMVLREHFRIPYGETVRLTALSSRNKDSVGLVSEAEGVDISAGGMQVASTLAFLPGDRLRAEFSLELGNEVRSFCTEGVLRTCLPSQYDKFALGLAFDSPLFVEAFSKDEVFRKRYLTYSVLGGSFNLFMIFVGLTFMTQVALKNWGAFGLVFVLYVWSRVVLKPFKSFGMFIWKERQALWSNPRSRRILLAGALGILGLLSFPTVRTVEGTFEVTYSERVVRSPEAARVVRVAVSEGMEVSPGQVLVELDASYFKAQRAQVAAQLQQAHWQLKALQAGLPKERLAVEKSQLRAAHTKRQGLTQKAQHLKTLPSGATKESEVFRALASEASAKQAFSEMSAQWQWVQAPAQPEEVAQLEEILSALQAELAHWDARILSCTVRASVSGVVVKGLAGLPFDGYGVFLEKGADMMRIREGGFPSLKAYFSGQQRLDVLERGSLAEAKLFGAPQEKLQGRVDALSVSPHKTPSETDFVATISLSEGMETGVWPAGLSGRIRLHGDYVPTWVLGYEFVEKAVRSTLRRLLE